MSRPRFVLFGLIALILGASWWWFRPSRDADEVPRDEVTVELRDDRRPVAGSDSEPDPAMIATNDESSGVESDASVVDAPRIRLRGSVIGRDDGWGLADARVGLFSARDTSGSGLWSTTNVHGGFEFEFATDEWPLGTFVRANVLDSASVQRFSGLVRLEQDVELHVLPALLLHGFVTTDFPLDDDARMKIALSVPARRATETPRLLGVADVELDGSFEIDTALDEPTSWLSARITLRSALDELTADFDVPVGELSSELGSRLFFAVATLRVRVLDRNGQPLPGARLQLGVPGALTPTFGSARASGEDGVVEALVAQGTIEIWARAPGHASRRTSIDVFDPLVESDLTLRELSSSDQIFGSVSAATGESAEGAQVFVAPLFAERAVGVELEPAVLTDARGGFRIALSNDEPLEVFARHSKFGLSRRHAVKLDASMHVLTLQRSATLRVQLATDALPGPFRAGGIEYLVVDSEGFGRERGVIASLPFDVGPLHPGTYDVFVLAPGFDACAMSMQVPVPPGRSEVLLSVRPAFWAEGRVLDADGAARGFFEITATGEWAPSADAFGVARTDETGWFRAFSPSRVCTLSFFDGESLREFRSVQLGELLEVTVP